MNLLENVVKIIADRTGQPEQEVLERIRTAWGSGQLEVAEDEIWHLVGPVIDKIQAVAGIEVKS